MYQLLKVMFWRSRQAGACPDIRDVGPAARICFAKIHTLFARPHVITYSATLDVPRDLIRYLAKLLEAERRHCGTRKNSRALSCWKQAIFVLAWFRKKEDITLLGAGFGLSRATSYRYHGEGVRVLAAQAPDLNEALDRVIEEGWAYVILDGTIVPTDRDHAPTTSVTGKQIDLWYSGKAHDHGGNLQGLMRPDGFPIWLSPVEPGSVHDLTAARLHVLGALYAAARRGLPTLADGGYIGSGHGIHVPVKHPGGTQVLHVNNRTYNALLRGLRALGERGFALLKTRWKALQHVTACPHKIANIGKAALVLTQFEHKYISC